MGDEPNSGPGPARRLAWRTFAALPRRARVSLVRQLTPNFTVGALCVLEHHDRILMLRQHHRQGWTLPGGLMNRGESPRDAVIREVAEETGLQIEPAARPLTVVVDAEDCRVDVIFHVRADTQPSVHASSEALACRWLAPQERGELDRSTAQALAAFAQARGPEPSTGVLLS